MVLLYIVWLTVIANLPYGKACLVDDYVIWRDWCYYVPPTEVFSWNAAEEYCQSAGMELASIHSREEMDFIYEYSVEARGVTNYWFGLIRDSDSFAWTDGTDFDYENWAQGEPSSDSEGCANLREDGTWNDLSCDGYELAVVCKGDADNIPPTEVVNGACLVDDYVTWSDWCYYVPPTGVFSWYAAEEYCQDGGMELASIHSREEMDFIYGYSIEARGVTNYWFGLIRDLDSFGWTDGTDFDYENWAQGEPSSDSEGCANLREDGTWNDLSCDGYELAVVCKGDAGNIPETQVYYMECSDGWFESTESRSCLQLHLEDKTWYDARDRCIGEGGDLVKIISEEMNNNITEKIIEAGTQNLWIGLHDDFAEGVFIWLDETEKNWWTNWDDNEPDNWADGAACVEIGVNIDDLSLWGDSDCYKTTYSICETAPAFSVECPIDWIISPISGTCIKFFNDTSSWDLARANCMVMGADLLKIQNEEMNDFIAEEITEAGIDHLWIGIHDSASEGTWVWLEESEEASYTNWADDQPDNSEANLAEGQDCAAIGLYESDLSLWGDTECTENLNYICEMFSLDDPAGCYQEKADCAALYDEKEVLPNRRCEGASAWYNCVLGLPEQGCESINDALFASADAAEVCYNTDDGAACKALQDSCRANFESRVESDPNLSCSYAAAWYSCHIKLEVIYECGPEVPEDVVQIRDDKCFAFLEH